MIPESEPTDHFRRSTFCNGGACVEVAARSEGDILVRDAKNPDPSAPVLHFTKIEWDAFLAGVHAGEFDHTSLIQRS